MNKTILLGRLVRDPEVKYTSTGKAVAQITLAVDKFSNGEKQADFIPVIFWEKQAELVGNNVVKGDRILVEGSISTRSYEAKDGSKRSVTEVIAQRMEFIERKEKTAGSGNSANESGMFEDMGKVFDTQVPF